MARFTSARRIASWFLVCCREHDSPCVKAGVERFAPRFFELDGRGLVPHYVVLPETADQHDHVDGIDRGIHTAAKDGADVPPSTLMDWPVMATDWLGYRNRAARATSSAVWPRPRKIVFWKPANCSFGLTPSLLASMLSDLGDCPEQHATHTHARVDF
jgi:hypothetical protein